MSGNVTDSRSHQPVEGVTVTVVGNKANPETTDREGNFILTFSTNTREGDVVRVRVQKTGYKVYEVNKPVSPTLPLQFSIDRIVATPNVNSQSSSSSGPKVSAPNGIAIGGDNLGSATVTNTFSDRFPRPGTIAKVNFCVFQSKPVGEQYETIITVQTDSEISAPYLGTVF